MTMPVIAEQALLKGLDIVGTADILHKKWFEHVKENLVEEGNGIFRHKKHGINFIIQTEVECNSRVHHVILLPDIESALALREKLLPHGKLDSEGFGRPKLRIDAEFIAQKVEECGGMIGPAHAFTPYFSVYAHFDSPEGLYKSMHDKIRFMELGLSADSAIADRIKQNWNYSFITTSDAHSPWPFRMGREFTRFRIKEPSFRQIRKALEEKESGGITLNVGLDPKEGKYHRTACSSCYTKFTPKQAEQFGWKCPKCGKAIKKGAKGRILELAAFEEEKHPSFRPPYLHIVPLAEIIQISLGRKDPKCNAVQSRWMNLVERFGSEIKVLIDTDVAEIKEADAETGAFIEAFRKGYVVYREGGGGLYGRPFICRSKEETERTRKKITKEEARETDFSGQKMLAEF
jgi:uncharacterized protein (TIGR00375 family)